MLLSVTNLFIYSVKIRKNEKNKEEVWVISESMVRHLKLTFYVKINRNGHIWTC